LFRDGAGLVSDYERESLAARVKSLYEEGAALQDKLEDKFDMHAQARLDVQRIQQATRRWQERQELEVAARVAAAESLAGRRGVLADLQRSLQKDRSDGGKAKLKVVDALLTLAASDATSRLARGEFVSLGLVMEDVETAVRAS